jgi:hypothetical protein
MSNLIRIIILSDLELAVEARELLPSAMVYEANQNGS